MRAIWRLTDFANRISLLRARRYRFRRRNDLLRRTQVRPEEPDDLHFHLQHRRIYLYHGD